MLAGNSTHAPRKCTGKEPHVTAQQRNSFCPPASHKEEPPRTLQQKAKEEPPWESLAGGQTLLGCYKGHLSASKGGNPPGGGLSTNLSLQRLSTNPRSAGFLYNSRGEIHPSSYTGRDVPDGITQGVKFTPSVIQPRF